MPRGRKKNSDDRSHFNNREQKIAIIQQSFPQMRGLLKQKAAMIAEHVKPLADDFTKLGRRLKAETGVERADWWPDFLRFCRDQDAADMDSAGDAQRIQQNLRLMHDALATGEMVNFLDALDEAAKAPDPMLEERQAVDAETGDEGKTGLTKNEEGREPAEPAGLTFASAEPREEGDPMLEETAQTWAETEGVEGNQEHLDQGGYTFAAGKKAGAEGLLACQNPHGEGNDAAELWERGRVVGAKEFLNAEANAVADEHEVEEGVIEEIAEDPEGAEVINLFGEEGDEELPPAEMLGAVEQTAQASA